MNILLDTHIILWTLFKRENLSEKAVQILSSGENNFFYSIASMLEIAIKHRKHPKQITRSGVEFMHYCEQSGYHKLPIDDLHVVELAGLVRDEDAPPHNDPFDRIMISQAKAEGFLFLSHDSMLAAYNEPCVIEV